MKTKAAKTKESKSASSKDKLKKAALAAIGARLSGKPAGQAAAKDAPAKAAKEPKPKRVSALDAAAMVLASSPAPLGAKDLVAKMAERGLWTSPGGKTPHATLYAAMCREIAAKAGASRFRKQAKGLFVAGGAA